VPTDAEIVRASLEEPAAFGEIFERHYDAIARFARRRAGEDVGEEIAARTFLIAFEKRDRFELTATSARPWLYGIATNLCRHHLRDERTHLTALGRLLDPDVGIGLDEDLDRWDAVRMGPVLARAIGELTRRDRDAFLLNVLADLSYAEVGEALGIPVGTVRSRIHRARQGLRERLAAERGIASETQRRPERPNDG